MACGCFRLLLEGLGQHVTCRALWLVAQSLSEELAQAQAQGDEKKLRHLQARIVEVSSPACMCMCA